VQSHCGSAHSLSHATEDIEKRCVLMGAPFFAAVGLWCSVAGDDSSIFVPETLYWPSIWDGNGEILPEKPAGASSTATGGHRKKVRPDGRTFFCVWVEGFTYLGVSFL